jgi:hypothetical protein
VRFQQVFQQSQIANEGNDSFEYQESPGRGHPMKVFLFGAGASKAAGYPLTSELEAELKKHAGSAGLQKPWETWQSLRKEMKESFKKTGGRHAQMMASHNPEVFLSVIDLYEEILVKPKQESRYLNACKAFLKCLRYYFEKKHEESCKKPPPPYLKEKLAELGKGDVVITLNWDTIVERTLLCDDRWAPTDGYGFKKALVVRMADGSTQPIPNSSQTSQICVLKLHDLSAGIGTAVTYISIMRNSCATFRFLLSQAPVGLTHRHQHRTKRLR